MGIFKNNSQGGLMDVIRCDEPSYLIWKWRPEGAKLGETKRENGIRFGSPISIKPGSMAYITYNDGTGNRSDIIEGPYDGVLDTNNLPIISGLLGLAYNGSAPFQAEVYFINLAEIISTKFAVPYFDVADPRYTDYTVPVAVRGTINFAIENCEHFIMLHRLDNFDISDLTSQIRDALVKEIKSCVTNAPDDYGISLIQIERRISEINDDVERRILNKFREKFAIEIKDLSIGAIELDKNSEGYKRLSRVAKTFGTGFALSQTATEIRENWGLSGAKINAEAKDIALDQKLGAVRKVGKLAYNLKEDRREEREQTLSRVADSGKNIISGVKELVGKKDKPGTPPPIPGSKAYHVAVDGQSTGPYKISELSKMAAEGTFSEDSLIWTDGMENWAKAADVEEIAKLFNKPAVPPVPNN